VILAGFTLERREGGAVPAGAGAGERDGGQLGAGQCPGSRTARPTRPVSPRARRARPPGVAPDTGTRQHARTTPRRQPHGALRTPLTM
jgi:hypothetical protein